MKPQNSKTVLETAVALSTSPARIYQMIRDGEIKGTNISNGSQMPRWVVLDEDFEAYRTKLYGVRTVPAIQVKRWV